MLAKGVIFQPIPKFLFARGSALWETLKSGSCEITANVLSSTHIWKSLLKVPLQFFIICIDMSSEMREGKEKKINYGNGPQPGLPHLYLQLPIHIELLNYTFYGIMHL